jgi:hypothetical protein
MSSAKKGEMKNFKNSSKDISYEVPWSSKKEVSIISKTTMDSQRKIRKKRKKRSKEEKISFLTQSIQRNESKLKDLELKQKKLEIESSGIINYKKLQKSKFN